MKKKIKFSLILFSLIALPQYIYSQEWFPLEIGNRWDYFVIEDYPGGIVEYDTVCSVILNKQILANGLEYYFFTNPIPLNSPAPKFFRQENNKIYFFNELDSSDCFAFRFDLPEDSFYTNCKGYELHIFEIDSSVTFGLPDIHQNQDFFYDFSSNFGVYHYFYPGIVERDYTLKGCIISGVTYGYLLVSVENYTALNENFLLHQNFPNPFNPTTKISWQSPVGSHQTVKVFDVLGNEIAILVDEYKPAGTYEVEFNATESPSGIYFYQLKAGSFVETKKMVLLR